MKNHFSNIFSSIKNGQLAKRDFIYHSRKKNCELFLKILWKEGFINGYVVSSIYPLKLKIFLKYNKTRPALNTLKFISKPSRRVYYSANQIWHVSLDKLFIVFSTTQGLKTISECRLQKIGGEPLIILN